METGVGSLNISSESQEALKDVIVAVRSSLMDGGVSVHVLPGGLHVAGSSN